MAKTAWEIVEIARNPKRKTALDYIEKVDKLLCHNYTIFFEILVKIAPKTFKSQNP